MGLHHFTVLSIETYGLLLGRGGGTNCVAFSRGPLPRLCIRWVRGKGRRGGGGRGGGVIDNTNQEGGTRLGINTRVGPRPECRARRADTSVDPDASSSPSRLVLLLSDLHIYIYLILKFYACNIFL